MPLAPNLIERLMMITLNQAPAVMLDMWSGPAFWCVHTALELNIFEALAKTPQTPAQLAGTLSADERGLAHLLNMIEALGYLRKDGERYRNSPLTEKWLLDTGDMNLSTFYLHWGAVMQYFMPKLTESIKTGTHQDFYGWIEDQPQYSRYFQEGLTQLARYVAKDIAKLMPIPAHAQTLLDVGGGHGEYAIAIAKQNPTLSAVIFDGAQALITGQATINEAGLTERISIQAGNFMLDDLPTGFDVALVFNIVHGLSPAVNIALFQKIRASLNAGGQIVVLEQIHGVSPLPISNTATQMLSMAYYLLLGGQVYTDADIRDWLQQAGFSNTQRKNVLKASSALFMATKTE